MVKTKSNISEVNIAGETRWVFKCSMPVCGHVGRNEDNEKNAVWGRTLHAQSRHPMMDPEKL